MGKEEKISKKKMEKKNMERMEKKRSDNELEERPKLLWKRRWDMEERETKLNVMFIENEFIDTIRNWKKTILLEINDINQQHLLSSNCINYDLRWKQSYAWENLNSNL